MNPSATAKVPRYSRTQTTCYGKTNETAYDALNHLGFVNITKVTDTLQGSIWRATEVLRHSPKKKVVIKTSNKRMHKRKTAHINGEINHIKENINMEQTILRHLTHNKRCPKSIVEFRRFLSTNTEYCLIMEDGGNSLFKFIMRAHKMIKKGKISISHWQQVIKVIFGQMIECIDYIHSQNISHFDISLENFVINDVEIKRKRKSSTQKKKQFTFVLDDIQVKLCDFGLAELFLNTKCKSRKFVGKPGYASPEVIGNKVGFDAKKNDIWCCGVCLFIMSTGMTPFKSASLSSQSFKCVVEYERISDVLRAWNILDYVDEELLKMFKSIFKYEKYRVSLEEIKAQINV